MTRDLIIIAEAGSNYNGSLSKAKQLADVAREAGADIIKFQTIYTSELYNTITPGLPYGKYTYADILDFRRSCELSESQWLELAEYCRSIGIQFSTSVFGPRSLAVAKLCQCSTIKLASTDWDNFYLIKLCVEALKDSGARLILSSGMSTPESMEYTIGYLNSLGAQIEYNILHCVSVYPSSLEASALARIAWLKNNTSCRIGYSDHTLDSRSALVALGLGATIFEKHFTIDKNDYGLDHKHASDPSELRQYCSALKSAHLATQDLKIELTPDETSTSNRAKRGFYAAKRIFSGERITHDLIMLVRPPTDISQNMYDKVVESVAQADIEPGEPITRQSLGW